MNNFIKDDSGKRFTTCTGTAKYGQFGIGFELYFMYLKWFTVVFVIMSLLAIGPMVSNIIGNYITENTYGMVRTTLAN